ncbi:MAG: polC [Candidatus Saccharibacteria bacterium]|nr:polC [Candidatus Saccharibacteria bacterium]
MSFGESILDAPLVFVDIETNGLDHVRGRIVEVAAIRVEQGIVVQSFRSLVDPEAPLPYYITNLTGITEGDLRGAPTFDQIADELQAVLKDAVFVAHNVRFDYSFLKQEFGRLGMQFLPKQLCTVKLSRALYPHERSHKLEDVIRRHGFTFSNRHRAYDDAAVLWQFIQYVRKHYPPEQVEAAVSKQIKQPALPKSLQPELVRNLPEGPGVYIFEDAVGRPLYVGKSVTIKKRVLSHFSRDHAETKEFKISQTIENIRAIETDGELAALLLESQLVKDLQPLYNRQLRRTAKLSLVKQSLSEGGYITVAVEEASTIDPADAQQILAVYPRRSRAKEALMTLARDYELCPKLMGMEKSSGACFWRQLHKCKGACNNEELADNYNQRLLRAFDRQRIQSWPYKGPILLQEKSTATTARAIVVDQWCVLGELVQQEYCEPVLESRPKHFDLDTYKILQSFLSTKIHKLRISPLSSDELQALSA